MGSKNTKNLIKMDTQKSNSNNNIIIKNMKKPQLNESNFPLGINNYSEWYIRNSEGQNKENEFKKVNKFITDFCLNNNFEELKCLKISIQFINYGDTQLVFVITLDNDKQYTLMVNQPKTKSGQGFEEYNNLLKFNKLYPEIIIKPIKYYVNPNNPQQELYITPYYYQARCIGVDPEEKEWGEWIPEPNYHYRIYSEKEAKVIKKCMVAMIIKFYDEKNNLGIVKYSLDGDDFMLKKGYENEELNEENIIKNFVVIAARKVIQIEFEEYINKIKKELRNDFKENENIIVKKKLRAPFSEKDINEGIKYGIKLRENNRNTKQNK